ncbi:hypothetical protein FS837_010180 [Tulasnella sp. UAMH 9824]|nr:hypothetical protein FS837_010180 [Tulasnella sp. UAMH 9824]
MSIAPSETLNRAKFEELNLDLPRKGLKPTRERVKVTLASALRLPPPLPATRVHSNQIRNEPPDLLKDRHDLPPPSSVPNRARPPTNTFGDAENDVR